MKKKYVISSKDVPGYSPANHVGTTNFRVIGPDTVGAEHMEVLVGVLEKGRGALPHHHPALEQAAYVLEGEGMVEIGDERQSVGPGDFCFFPRGMRHQVEVTSEEPMRLIVMYSPPYMEDKSKTVVG